MILISNVGTSRTKGLRQLVMKSCLFRAVSVACLVLVFAGSHALANENVIPRAQHSWGRFHLGSWKTVEVTNDTLDENGNVTSSSTTETTTTLVAVDDQGYTLQIDVVVEVAGKRFPRPPQRVRYGFNGQRDGQKMSVEKVGAGKVTVDGVEIPCEIHKVIINGGDAKQVSMVYYSPDKSPHLLRRETTLTNGQSEKSQYTSTSEVIALAEPCRVLDEMKSAAHVKTEQKRADSSSSTLEVHCQDVPGGVVSHTSTERDANDKVVRRSELKLVNYGVGTGEIKTSLRERIRQHIQSHRLRWR